MGKYILKSYNKGTTKSKPTIASMEMIHQRLKKGSKVTRCGKTGLFPLEMISDGCVNFYLEHYLRLL